MFPPAKILLLFLAAAAQYIALKPPNPPPSKGDQVNEKTYFEKSIRVVTLVTRNSVVACLTLEAAVLLLLYFETPQSTHNVLMNMCPGRASLTGLSTVSRSFLVGICLMFPAAALRIWCYKTLGTLFTYEITIRPGHKLLTSGPYAYVRHPGYTASISMIIGTAFACLGSHSYISECQIMSTPARRVVHAWIALMVYVIVSLVRRGKIEDEGLREVFEESWDKYSDDVPCRFIPGLV